MGKGARAVVLSVLGTLILVLAACAPAATPTPTATPTPPPAVATPTPPPGVATPTPAPGVATPTPTATPTLVAGMPVGYGYSPFGEWGMPLNMPPPQYGGILRDGYTLMPSHYDSHRSAASSEAQLSMIIDPLIRVSPYLDVGIIPGTYELKHVAPNLAEKWEVSQDGLAVTFYLKKGVKWTDGKPFTSKDVKHSLDKLRDPAKSVWTPDLAMVDRVEAVDDYTVKVYLKFTASRLFLLSMAMVQLGMQAEHLKDVSYRTTDFVVGTGPFKFVSYTLGIELVMTKNPDYHFRGRPYFDGVKVYVFPTKEGAMQALVAGQVDFSEQTTGEQYMEMVKKFAPEIKVLTSTKLGAINMIYFSFVREGPWQDVRVRKAVAMVLDREEACLASMGNLAKQLCIPQGGYFASAPAGRGLPWSEYEKAWLQDRPMEERVAAAKKLLAEAGYPNGFKTTTIATATLGGAQLVNMDALRRRLNIEVTANIIPNAILAPLRQRGEFDIHDTVTVPHIGAMEQYVSNVYIKGGQYNFGQYTHPQVEELYINLIREQDYDKALDIFHKIERILINDVPTAPWRTYGQQAYYWPYIKPKMFYHPLFVTQYNSKYTVTWFDKNDPTWAKRVK